jgi:hypothetical protein
MVRSRQLVNCDETLLRPRALLCAFLFLPIIAGCGSGLASVNGTVTLDEKPAGGPDRYGTVTFYQESGSGTPAVGIIDESGGYRLKTGSRDGIEPGTYLIAVAIKKVTPPAAPGGMPQATLISPPKYASVTDSGFRNEVKPGRNSIDLELSSKKR